VPRTDTGTVLVAARVVSDNLITAAIASFEMCAQCPRAAQADIPQRPPLLVRQCTTPALKELFLMSMENIGHFKPTSSHAVLFPPWAVRLMRMGRSSSRLGVTRPKIRLTGYVVCRCRLAIVTLAKPII
jgi:hypothetical protein